MSRLIDSYRHKFDHDPVSRSFYRPALPHRVSPHPCSYRVIMEELREELPDRGPPPALQLPTQLQSEAAQQLMTQLGKMVRIVGDRLKADTEFQEYVGGFQCTSHIYIQGIWIRADVSF